MAVNKTHTDVKLVLAYETGEMKGDAPVLTTKTYSNVILSATDDDILAAGAKIASLQERALDSVRRVDYNELTQGA